MGDTNRLSALMQIIGSLLLIVLVLVLTYYVSRWYARRVGSSGSGNNLKILEKVSVGQGSMLVILGVGERRYLVGVSDKNMQLICELDPDSLSLETPGPLPAQFGKLFQEFLARSKKSADKPDDGGNK